MDTKSGISMPGTAGEHLLQQRFGTVEEAYIHCAKHIPRLRKVTAEERAWGTDDVQRKGGDFFKAAATQDR
ncbi:hypothetical protein ACFPIJ_39730 [Dactylosporangium cerinum]|uniref:Uncharacterized protein n=1 Tax=Dactylosporangium cerinum TaxID=1434730 RepID=A0ABV9W614_9ACTN